MFLGFVQLLLCSLGFFEVPRGSPGASRGHLEEVPVLLVYLRLRFIDLPLVCKSPKANISCSSTFQAEPLSFKFL